MSTQLTVPEKYKSFALALPEDMRAVLASQFGAALDTLGASMPRISLKGNRFRLTEGANEEVLNEPFLDVVILAMGTENYHTYFKKKFDGNGENEKPDAVWSEHDPIPEGVPTDLDENGRKRYNTRRRILVSRVNFVPATGEMSIPDLSKVYVLDVSALSLFGDAQPAQNLHNFVSYTGWLKAQGLYPALLGTRLVFDSAQSVPVLRFCPWVGNDRKAILFPVPLIERIVSHITKDKPVLDNLLEWRRTEAPTQQAAPVQQPVQQQQAAPVQQPVQQQQAAPVQQPVQQQQSAPVFAQPGDQQQQQQQQQSAPVFAQPDSQPQQPVQQQQQQAAPVQQQQSGGTDLTDMLNSLANVAFDE